MAQALTSEGPITCLRRHAADPAHNTLAQTVAAQRSPALLPSRFSLRRAPPLKSGVEEQPPPSDPSTGDPGGGSKGGRSSSCRPRCIWGDAVCRALLGESWGGGSSCDDEPDEELAPELRGDGEQGAPVPIARQRVST
jgi:hypothetical protein